MPSASVAHAELDAGAWRETSAKGLQVLKDTRGTNGDVFTALELSFQQGRDPKGGATCGR